jgi:hypothetical protein
MGNLEGLRAPLDIGSQKEIFAATGNQISILRISSPYPILCTNWATPLLRSGDLKIVPPTSPFDIHPSYHDYPHKHISLYLLPNYTTMKKITLVTKRVSPFHSTSDTSCSWSSATSERLYGFIRLSVQPFTPCTNRNLPIITNLI